MTDSYVEPLTPLARAAYEAYCERAGGRSVHGEELPSWDDQRPEIQVNWVAAVRAVVQALPREDPDAEQPLRFDDNARESDSG